MKKLESPWLTQQKENEKQIGEKEGRENKEKYVCSVMLLQTKVQVCPYLQILNKSHHVPKSFRHLEFLFRTWKWGQVSCLGCYSAK